MLAVVGIVCVDMGIKSFKAGKTKKVILDIAIVPTYLVSLFFIMVVFQAVFVTTNELDKEKGYIETNINYTRNAYGINVDEVNLNNNIENITGQDLKKYESVINNTAIVSKDIVLKDLNNGQTAKGYYYFRDSQLEKYSINGKEKLVYMSPREIISANGTYNNKTYEYTHGYSAIITSGTSTKENGTLDHMQKGFDSSNEALTVTQPRIYFGMQTDDTAVTGSTRKN